MQYSWALSPSVGADLTLRGGKITRPALEMLRKQVDLLIDALTMEEESEQPQLPTLQQVAESGRGLLPDLSEFETRLGERGSVR